MYKIVLKYNLVEILSFEDTFLYTTSLPKKVKFSKELLRFNYLKHSPFINSDLLHLFQDKELYIWFSKKKIDAKFAIPESYLAYKILSKTIKETICIIYDDIIKIVIIKDSKLFNAFTVKNLDETTLLIMKEEFQLENIVEIDKAKYKGLITSAKESLSLKELYDFNQFEFERNKIIENIVDTLSYPISFLILFAIFVNYMQGYIVKDDISELKKIYLEKKENNRELKRMIKEHNFEVKEYKNFTKREFLFYDGYEILNQLYSIIDSKEFNIKFVAVTGDILRVQFEAGKIDAIQVLDKLNKIKILDNVVLKNSYKPRRSKKSIFIYTAKIQTIKAH